MEFQDVVRRRRMVRNFESRPVPPDIVDRILANALHAPSAGFTQGWAFLVLEGREHTERFWNTTWEIGQARADLSRRHGTDSAGLPPAWIATRC